MEEMKSALERALERADQLGKLSPEEMQKKREEEHWPIGEGLARQYLGHGYDSVFIEQINKYSVEERSMITAAALRALVQSIELGKDDQVRKAVQGVVLLRDGQLIEDACDQIEVLLREFALAKQERDEEER